MKRPALVLLVLAVTFVVYGLLQPIVPPRHERATALVHGLVIGVLCYLWCKADSFARNSVPPGRAALWAGLFPFIGIPAYFFRTRTKGAATRGTLKALGLLLGLVILEAAVAGVVGALRT